jgi:hypothetical protein
LSRPMATVISTSSITRQLDHPAARSPGSSITR